MCRRKRWRMRTSMSGSSSTISIFGGMTALDPVGPVYSFKGHSINLDAAWLGYGPVLRLCVGDKIGWQTDVILRDIVRQVSPPEVHPVSQQISRQPVA